MHSLFNKNMQGKESLFKLLEANDKKTTVAVFDTYPIYEEEIPRLVNIINTNTHLKALKLLDCRLSAEGTTTIATAVLNNKTLEEVKIENFADDNQTLKDLLTVTMLSHLQQNITANNTPSASAGI